MGADSSVKVGVLTLHNSKETKAILDAVEALGHNTEWLRRENITISLGPDNSVALELDVDVLINRLLLSNIYRPSHALGIAESYANVRPVINRPSAVLRALHKFTGASHLRAGGHPHTKHGVRSRCPPSRRPARCRHSIRPLCSNKTKWTIDSSH